MPQILAVALCSILAAASMLGGGMALDAANTASNAGSGQQQDSGSQSGSAQNDGDRGSDGTQKTDAVLGTSELIDGSGDSTRAANLTEATAKLDGTTIEPGASFSLREALGLSSTGAQKAPAAGYDQVASALYAAALEAGLDVTERHQGDGADGFVATGLEASVESGQNDLRIKNNGTSAVTVKASSQGQKVTVSIVGTDEDPSVKRDLVARIVDAGDSGKTQIESYLIVYEDGVKTDEEKVATSTYGNGSDTADGGAGDDASTGGSGTSGGSDGGTSTSGTDGSDSASSTGSSDADDDADSRSQAPVNPVPSRGGTSPTK